MASLISKLLATVALAALLTACDVRTGRPEQNEQIQAAVETYIASRTDISSGSMSVQVASVEVNGDKATAKVTISARGDAATKMEMTYQLQQAAGRWEVVPRAGEAPGGAPGGLPQGHPPVQPQQ